FNCPFVDFSGNDVDRNPGTLQNGAPAIAFRREHQSSRGKPERHAHATGWRRRSARRLMTAAAVSSIERRVTSMLGQLCLAQRRRESAISSATALRSIY